jgi:hypothetical protein
MPKRSPVCCYRVAGHGHEDRIYARSRGAAVRRFARQHRLTLRTDHGTGGFERVSLECEGRANVQ